MIHFTRNQLDKFFKEEDVIAWTKKAVCDYFKIDEATLGNPTRERVSSYPRKIYWYFLRCRYNVANRLCLQIADHEFDHAAVTIQSQTVLLKKYTDLELREELNQIEKILMTYENS